MNTTNIRFASNRLRDVRELYRTELAGLYPIEEVNTFFAMLCEEYLGYDTAAMLMHLPEPINQSDLLCFHWALEGLLEQRPVQHIIGHVEFCGCRIEVNPSVLIPRPETEEIVRGLIADGRWQMAHILDLCTGSGCIAIALKRAFPEAEVTGVDISEEALATARSNAESNNVEVNFLQTDILNSQFSTLNSPFDLIVSNPPYVLDSERATMQRNVLEHDPALALFVSDSDPLRFYRAIGLFALNHLSTDGLLAFEINHLQAQQTEALLREQGFETELCDDFRGQPRLIRCRLPRHHHRRP